MNEPKGYISLSEAAKLTGYSAGHIRRLCVSGKLQAQKVGKTWLVTPYELNKLTQGVSAQAPTLPEIVGTSVFSYSKIQKLTGLAVGLMVFVPVVSNLTNFPDRMATLADKTNQVVVTTQATINDRIKSYIQNQILGLGQVAGSTTIVYQIEASTQPVKPQVLGINISDADVLAAVRAIMFNETLSAELVAKFKGEKGEPGIPGLPGQPGTVGGTTVNYIPNSGSVFGTTAPTAPQGHQGTIGSATYLSAREFHTETITVTARATFNGEVNLSGTSNLSTTNINGNLTVIGNQNNTGDFNLTGNFVLAGNQDITGDLEIVGDQTNTGNFFVTGDTELTGDLDIIGDSTFTGHILPGTDDLFNIGSSTARWNQVNAGPTGIIVRNDATNTNKVSLDFSGTTARLVTDAATPLQISTGANVGINMLTNGRVGIGTTTPTTDLQLNQSALGSAFEIRRFSDITPTGNLIKITDATGLTPFLVVTAEGDMSIDGDFTQNGGTDFTTSTGNLNFWNTNINLNATAPIIDLTSASTLSINTANNRPVTFGTGLVSIPNLYVTNSQSNNGTMVIDSSATTATIFEVIGNSLTSGTAIQKTVTANAGNGQITKGEILNLTDATVAGGGFTGIGITVTGVGVGSGNKYLLSLSPVTATNEVVFDNTGAFRPTTSAGTNTNSLGSPSFYWKSGYFDTINANNLSGTVITGATSSTTWTIGSTEVGDVNEAIIFQRNSGSGNAIFQWNGGAGDLRYLGVNYPFNSTYTVDDASIGTGVNLYSGALTNNTTGGTQKLLSLTNTGTGTTETGIYINNTGTANTAFEIAGTWTTGILTNNNSIDTGTGTITSGLINGQTISSAANFTGTVTVATSVSTPSIISAAAVGITPAAGSNLNVNLSTTGDFVVNTDDLYLDTSTGFLGIGTTSPQHKLHVHEGSTNGTRLQFSNTDTGAATNDGLQIGVGNTEIGFLWNYENTDLYFGTNNTERLRILAAGNVGIGTSNPGAKLEIGSGQIFVPNGTTGAPSYSFTNDPDTGITWYNTNRISIASGGAEAMRIGYSGSSYQALGQNGIVTQPYWSFMDDPDTGIYTPTTNKLGLVTAGVERVTIDASGNVGIGTTTPGAAIHAYSASAFQGLFSGYSSITGATSGANGEIRIGATTSFQGRITYDGLNSGDMFIDNSWDDATGDIYLRTRTAGTPVNGIVVKGSGNVGIGTASPGYPLEVIGSARVSTYLGVGIAPSSTYSVNAASHINLNGRIDFNGGDARITEGSPSNYDLLFQNYDGVSAMVNTMVLKSSGNVGFGTTNPVNKIQIEGTDNYIRFTDSGDTGTTASDGSRIGLNGLELFIDNQESSAIVFRTSATSRWNISSTGHFLASTDNTYDIGASGATRPRTVYVGTSVVSPSLTISGLTSGRVVFSTTGGALTDDSDFTFATDTLTATKVLAPTSVSTPSLISTGAIGITPAAGSNLNINLSTTGDLAVNTSQLYVDTSTGNVGIGTTTPTSNVHIIDSSATRNTLTVSKTTSSEGYSALDVYHNTGLATRNIAIFRADTSTAMAIVGNGYVGIGTGSPQKMLHVKGDADFILELDTVVSGANLIQNTFMVNGAQVGEIQYARSQGILAIGTGTSANSVQTQLVLKNDGNVGIGTTSPQSLLHINGAAGAGTLRIANTNSGNTATDGFFVGLATAGANVDLWNYENGYIRFATNNTERWNISASGHFLASTDNTYDIGASGATRPRTGYFGTSVVTPALSITGLTQGSVVFAGASGALSQDNANFFWDNGNTRLGIGTSIPSQSLHISRTSPVIQLTRSTDGGDHLIDASNASQLVFSADANNEIASTVMRFLTDGSERMRIDSSGNVGIGTTIPSTALHLYKDSFSNLGTILIDQPTAPAGGSTSIGPYISMKSAGVDRGWIGFFDYPTHGNGTTLNIKSNGDIRLGTGDTTDDGDMIITSTGNVGIGTTNPSTAKLAVVGGGISVTRNSADGSATAFPSVRLINTRVSAGINDFSFTSFDLTSNNGALNGQLFTDGSGFLNSGTPNMYLRVATNHPLLFGTNNLERMRISASGNVGIGTTAPGEKLDVRDGALILTDTDVVHGMTVLAPTNSFGQLGAFSGTAGGLKVQGFSDTDATGLVLYGIMGAADPTDSTPATLFRSGKVNGTSFQPVGSLETAYQFRNDSTDLVTILGSGNVGIGTTGPSGLLHLSSATTSLPLSIIENTNADATGSKLRLLKTSASPAAADVLGNLSFMGGDNQGTPDPKEYINIQGISEYIVNGDESGGLKINLEMDNSTAQFAYFDAYNGSVGQGTITMGNSSNDIDFIVSNAGSANSLFVQGSSGNVGIGTTGPNARLTIKSSGATSQDLFHIEDSGVRMLEVISDASGNALLDVKDTSGVNKIRLNSAGDSYLTGGNVGIGTAAPTSKFQVRLGTDQNIGFNDATGVSRISSYNDAFTLATPLIINGADLRFSISASEKMRIDTNGNVGIGTTAPTRKLQVHETAAATTVELKFTNGTTGALVTDGFGVGYSSADSAYVWNYENTALRFGTNNTEKWQISAAGHLLAFADNTYDIGASGATRPRTIYVGTSIGIGGAPTFALDIVPTDGGGIRVHDGSNNEIQLINSTGTDIGTLKTVNQNLLIAATGTTKNITFTPTGNNIFSAGNVLFTDNTQDIGASGATRPRTGYFGTGVTIGSGASTDASLVIRGAGATSATNSLLIEDSSGTDYFVVKNDGTTTVGKNITLTDSTAYAVVGNSSITVTNNSGGNRGGGTNGFNMNVTIANTGASDSISSASAGSFGMYSRNTASGNMIVGVSGSARIGNATGRAERMTGGNFSANSDDATGGTIDIASGIVASAINNNAGVTSTTLQALNLTTTNVGTTGSAYGLNLASITNSGTITNTYGIYVGDITTGTQTNQAYGIYQVDTNARNFFAGNVGIGTTSPIKLLHIAASNSNADFIIERASGDTSGSDINTYKARGSLSSKTIVQADDGLGSLTFRGYDGSSYRAAAYIVGAVDGTPGSGDMPGRIQFYTSPDGSITPEVRMTIKNDGNVGIGTTNPSQAKLQVLGAGATSATNSLVIENSAGLDYVTARNDGRLYVGHDVTLTSGAGYTPLIVGDADTSDIRITNATGGAVTASGITVSVRGAGDASNPFSGGSGTGLSGVHILAYNRGSATTTVLRGLYSRVELETTTARADTINGGYFWPRTNDATGGTITTLSGVEVQPDITTAGVTVTNTYGFRVLPLINAATATNTYGLYIDDITTGTQTNQAYGIYQVDTNARNFFGGSVGIGTTNPTSPLTVTQAASSSTQAVKINANGANDLAAFYIDQAGVDARGLLVNTISTTQADYIADFRLSGVSKFFIGGDGNVGIGTTAPLGKLDITGAQSDTLGAGSINITNSINTARGFAIRLTADTTSDLAFDRNFGGSWAESLRIQRSTGNVGIGTTNPSFRLHVKTDINNNTLTAANVINTVNTAAILAFNDTTTTDAGTMIILGHGSSGTAYAGIGSGREAASKSDLRFFTQNGAGAGLEAMRIMASGNVGIGTTTPSFRTHILGVSGTAGATPIVQADRDNSGTLFTWRRLSTGAGDRVGSLSADSDGTSITFNSGAQFIYGQNSTGDMLFATGSAEKMRIEAGGNVGIGTTNPDHKLDVVGDIRYSGYLYAPNGAAANPSIRFFTGASGLFTTNGDNLGLSTVGVERLFISNTGLVSIASLLSCGGIQTNGSGTMSCTSDERLKDKQGAFTDGLSAINQIRAETYTWKTDSGLYDGGVQYSGFIAQNIQSAIPQAVNVNSNGNLQVNTTTILAAAINAIQQLDNKTAGNYAGAGLEVGEIVAASGSNSVIKATSENNAIGVVSSTSGTTRVQYIGRMNVKVSEENGSVNAGDRLQVSTMLPGYAAKMTASGTSIGTALENSAGGVEGTDIIEVMVSIGYQKINVAQNQMNGQLFTVDSTYDFNNNSLINVKTIASMNGTWSISEDGRLVIQEIQTQKLCIGLTCVDEPTLMQLLQDAGLSGQGSAPSGGGSGDGGVVSGEGTEGGEQGSGELEGEEPEPEEEVVPEPEPEPTPEE